MSTPRLSRLSWSDDAQERALPNVGRYRRSDWLGESLSVRVPSLGASGALPRLWDAAANQETLDRGMQAAHHSLSPSAAAQAYRSPKYGATFKMHRFESVLRNEMRNLQIPPKSPKG
ncbi:hypothetical protein PAAG_02249 [Paracoccidioides lutzii Pb01]|uniref:Uncharacterized protein n=1 Tax=Paracoccidioides lutzii (strain ATCC MYA-826 / Pb01) TaxID=502779 RepID=C1GVH2_PARBA|nr:hypothetical protein PAAG_02249 [Paracoccidioides lutzii Pb01]EEH40194.2 hypothetical protein PAAG_02249 [Paracoccidioides lutzii Pb01]